MVYIIFNKLLPSVEKIKKPATTEKTGTNANLVTFLLGGGLMIATSFISFFLLRDVVKDPAALGGAIGLFIGFVAIMFQISTKEEYFSLFWEAFYTPLERFCIALRR